MRHVVAESGGDAGEMEPFRAVKNRFPVEILTRRHADRGVFAVVDDLGRTLGRTFFEKIDSHSLAAARDFVDCDALGTQRADRHISNRVRREFGDERRVHAEMRERHGDICLAAAEACFKFVCLLKAQIALRAKAKHQFSETYNFAHIQFPPK